MALCVVGRAGVWVSVRLPVSTTNRSHSATTVLRGHALSFPDMNEGDRRWERRVEGLERVLRAIEQHTVSEVRWEALADLANISPYHFHRLFTSYTGYAVGAYLRRVRLRQAARALLVKRISVTEAAELAGYATPAAFTRAFGQHFGTNPTTFVAERVNARPTSRLPQIALAAEPRYVNIHPFAVLAVQRQGAYNKAPWAAWQALRDLLAARGTNPLAFRRVGVPLDWPEITEEPQLRYEACVITDMHPGEGAFIRTIGGGCFAVFDYRGWYEHIPAAYEELFWHWFPEAGVELRDAPTFDRYLDANPQVVPPSELRTQIYVPVVAPPARVATHSTVIAID